LTLNKKIRNHQLEQWNFILVAGEEEVKNGTVDIRTRENKRMGKMRIDKLVAYFESLMPAKSTMYQQFYEKAWDPAQFDCHEVHSEPVSKKETVSIVASDPTNPAVMMAQVVADVVGAEVDIEITKEASKSISGRFPYMSLPDGTIISEAEAILKHLARMNNSAGLLGKHSFEHAKINEWLAWSQSNWLPKLHPVVFNLFGIGKPDPSKFSAGVKDLKECAKTLNGYLKDKKWLVGETLSLADIYVGTMLMTAFQLVFDAGFRKAMQNLTSWF